MTNKEARGLMKLHGHRFGYCTTCHRPMIYCGYCGNNCCNGGSGGYADTSNIVWKCNDPDDGEWFLRFNRPYHFECIDKCKEAYEIEFSVKYPLWMELRAKAYKLFCIDLCPWIIRNRIMHRLHLGRWKNI